MFYLLVYNDNTHNMYLNKLLTSVRKFGKNFKIVKFNKNDMNTDFVNKNKNILSCQRGGGYWLWKPYIIHKTLTQINDNDIVFYIDSSYYFIEDNIENIFLDYMKNNNILVWKNKPNEKVWYMKNWCKMDVILKYNMYDKIFNKNVEDCWGGALVIKKNKASIKFIKDWLDMCCIYEDITDSSSKAKNSSLFREHRHDQSLLSILLHKNNIKMQYFEKKKLQNIRVPF